MSKDKKKSTASQLSEEEKAILIAERQAELQNELGINPDTLNRAFYKTNFVSIDYLCGFNKYDEDGNIIHKVRGPREDALIALSGGQNCGKSTLGAQMGGAIVKPFKASDFIYVGTENGMEPTRIMQLTGLNNQDLMTGRLLVLPREECYLEDIRKMVDKVIKKKSENPHLYKEVQLTCDGTYMERYVPTIIMIDSITAMTSGEVEDSETEVKEADRYEKFNNTKFMNKNKITGEAILDMRIKTSGYNIIFIVIAHCTDKLNLGNTPNKKDFKGLSADVKILGNKKLLYETELGLFMNRYEYTSKTQTDELCKKVGLPEVISEEDINKDLFAVQTQVFKSRYGSSTRTAEFSLVFKDGTFQPFQSLLLDVTDRYKFLLPKGSAGFGMPGFEKSFYKKDAPELIRTNSDFRVAFVNNIESYFKDYLDIDSKTKRLRESEELITSMF